MCDRAYEKGDKEIDGVRKRIIHIGRGKILNKVIVKKLEACR